MTQNTLIKTLAAVAAGLLALACTKPIETQLSLSEKAANFENAANLEKTVKVTCNVDWTVSCTESWVSLSPASGTGDGSFKITVTPNEAFSERTAVVKVVAAEKSAEVQVTQFANVPSVAITPASTDAVAAAGGTVEVTVTSNTDWTVTSSQDWAQVSPASGSKSGKFTVTVAANAAFEERSATITATAQDKTAEITIKQQANVRSLEIAPATTNVANAGGTVEVTVTANTNWTVTLPEEAAWLKADVKEGEGNGKVVFTVEANVTDLKGRSANVSFKVTGIEKVLAISQDKAAYSHVTDSLALVAIYNAADGANWKAERRWDLSKTIDTFDGVKLTNGRVTQVAITAAGVISSDWTLPAEVGNLSELAILKFNQCKLTGNIPEEVYGLAKLTDLYLQNNNLTGSLSEKLG